MSFDDRLIIDNFAGGGGASTGIELALGRSPDVAINHDAEAVALHAANHPDTLHLCQNVWKADPREVVRQASARRCALLGIPFRELPVGFAWFSPDCKHFSKAKGSKPVEKGIRDLAWVVVHWAKRVLPDIIALENVEEFKDWGPLVATEDGKLVPCTLKVSKGATFRRWCRELRRLGYKVEHRELRACDYGAPTIRKRLFVVARRDGIPIRWAEPSHARPDDAGIVAGGLAPWRTAAECIDWDLDCPSIFERHRPLAENTLRRVARGVMRYVVNAERPFIVGVGGRMGQSPERPVDMPAQTLTAKADSAVVQPFTVSVAHGDSGGRREYPVTEPLGTVQASGNSHAVVEPFIVGAGGPVYSGKPVPVDRPLGAQTTENHRAIVQPFVAGIDNKSNGDRDAWDAGDPLRTITVENRFAVVEPFISRVDQTSAVERNGISRIDEPLRTLHTANPFALIAPLTHQGADRGQPVDEPLRTVTGAHRGEQALIAAHVTKFRTGSDGQPITEPLHTITANSFIKRPGGAAPLGLVSATLVQTGYGEREGQAPRAMDVEKPLGTVVAGGPKHALVAAFMAQHNTGNDGHPVEEPVSTIVGKGCTQGVVEAKAAILSHNYSSNTAGGNGDPRQPAKTITTGGHHSLVECDLSAEDLAGAERVSAFITKYYSAAEHGQPVDEPLHTTTAKPRFALVTVNGWPIVDIGLRMLQPRELYRAQGFPTGYVIDGLAPNGKPMTKTAQVRMCGNSVCPPIAQAIARALVFGDADVAEDRAAD